ncbi:MAG: rhamnulokinase family protein [Bryobacteraceae bacterium]
MNRRYLALDLGAESGRGMLANIADRKIELTELRRFANTPVRLPDGLYWDTLRLFHEICESIRAASDVSDHLDGIGIDTWGVDFGLIGADGSLIGNPRHYRDARNRGIPEQVFRTVSREDVFGQTGIQFMDINSLYQLYAFRRDSPELLELASKLLFMPDLLNYFLTGAFASERTIASTSQFYDPVGKCFTTGLLEKLGIKSSFLAELRNPGAELGPLLPHVSDYCGLKNDSVVYTTASHDTASAVAAVPAGSSPNWCYISSGTWSLMGVEIDEPIINSASLAANFTNETGLAGTIRFLKNIPGLWLVQECRRAWIREGQEYSYVELVARAATAKPIRTLIDLDEFTAAGNHPERIRDYCRKTGQEIPEDAGAMTRVVLQSLAARYKEVLELLEKLTGKRIDVIHIVGGGSRNRLLNQLAADFTERRVIAGPAEATAAGNALVQALGAGEIGSPIELRDVVTHSFAVEEFTPNRR